MKFALITYDPKKKEGSSLDEDLLLLAFLKEKGLTIDHLIWNDPAVNWNEYQVVIIKSPWDYHENWQAFNGWLDKLSSLAIKVLNPPSLMKWNLDKHYLQEIAQAGFLTVPSLFLEVGGTPDYNDLFKHFNSAKLVIKPCVSAGANNTSVITTDNFLNEQGRIAKLLQFESLIVQPFMAEILNGEMSLYFFNGKFSHAVLKTPAKGDFRVQGGNVQAISPATEILENAQRLIEKFAVSSLYARVDGILSDEKLMLMELELIEPVLYLTTNIKALENYYQALIAISDIQEI